MNLHQLVGLKGRGLCLGQVLSDVLERLKNILENSAEKQWFFYLMEVFPLLLFLWINKIHHNSPLS